MELHTVVVNDLGDIVENMRQFAGVVRSMEDPHTLAPTALVDVEGSTDPRTVVDAQLWWIKREAAKRDLVFGIKVGTFGHGWEFRPVGCPSFLVESE